MKDIFMVFARWSAIDTHYELVDTVDTQAKADSLAAKQPARGAIATRIEVRQIPTGKGGQDADED